MNDHLGLYLDHRCFLAQTTKIRDLGGTNVPFQEFPAPAKVNAAFDRIDRSGQAGRMIVLKCRRAFVSAAIAAQYWRRTAFMPGRTCTVVAHEKPAAKALAELYLQLDDSYADTYEAREQNKLPLLAKLKRLGVNSERILFSRGSQIKIVTAGNTQAARSFTSHYLHLSEVAFYEDPATFLTGALQTAPRRPGCMVVVESTANGIGDEFHKLWLAAERGQSGFIPIFFAWWEHPEYVIPLADSELERFGNSLTLDEQGIQRAYGLTLEQLNWRRWAIANQCRGSLDVFRQEYPGNSEEAFLTTGTAFFDRAVLERQPVAEPAERGRLIYGEDEMERRIIFTPADHGELTIWARPRPGVFYSAGADIAQGIDAAGKNSGARDPDYTYIPVIEVESGVQVAAWHGRKTPNEAARIAYILLRWYNWAHLTPEANSIGIAFIEQLIDLSYPMERIYRRQREGNEFGNPNLEELGYYQTGGEKGSRWHMLTVLDAYYRAGRIQMRDAQARQEHHTFATDAGGTPRAVKGNHDDRVFGMGLLAVGLEQACMVKASAERVKTEPMTRSIQYARPGHQRKERDW